ncbi:phage tail protein, partial [Escherichia coli]|nr:phage tail protein [Escherichia coli]
VQLGEVANAPYIKSRGGNANGSWTIWSDGAIELTGMSQGVVNGLATINYPIALPYVSRHISIAEHQAVDTGTTDNYVHVSTIIGDQITKSGFKARCTMAATGTPSSSGFSWRVYCAPSV